MRSILGASSKRRQQLLLLSVLLLALFITFFFGVRAFRRVRHPPSNEPIRAWMSIPYIAHSYGVPPPVLWAALDPPADLPPSRRPIRRLAAELNLTTDEIITRLEKAIADERAKHPPPPERRAKPPPAATPAPAVTPSPPP